MDKKGAVEWDTIIPWIIGFFILGFGLFLFGMLYGKGGGALDFFKNILRFG
jgi:hypothetical protein